MGIAVLIALVLLVALATSLSGCSSDEEGEGEVGETAVALTEPELLLKSRALKGTVFWAGLQTDRAWHVLSTAPNGVVAVRYLVDPADACNPRAASVVVKTYPVPDAQRALRERERAEGGKTVTSGRGFDFLVEPDSGRAYVVFPDVPKYLAEVYSSIPGKARAIAVSGAVRELD